MSETQVKKVKRKKEEKLGFNWFFWISFVFLLIPCCYFVYLLFQASQESNVPIVGDRIKNTIIYSIDDTDTQTIQSEISQLDNVESCETNLIVETMRITVNAADDLTDEQYQQLCKDIYNIVDSHLPIATYFTRDGDYKQYDLEITVYDNLDSEEPVIYVLSKNGSQEEYSLQNLGEPLNADLAYSVTHPETEDEETETPVSDGSTSGG